MENKEKNKVSIGWMFVWMFITAALVYSITTLSYNKAMCFISKIVFP